jgi:hypothetical protein
MSTFPVTSNIEITLQSYYGGPGYPGTPPPLGTPWLTEFTLSVGTTEIDFALAPTLQALLAADPPVFSCPGLVVELGGVTYEF